MLVLTRKTNERIILSNGIEICVTHISPHAVKLGITAPPDVTILRQELILFTPTLRDPLSAAAERIVDNK